MKWVKFILSALWAAGPLCGMAQSADGEIEMADAMHANGKIYVVVAVVAIIMTGLIIYLISIDRKLNRIEKDLNAHHPS
jgi:hypothetical protein